ncbi:unnamed protein product [Amaranthus hypochondriacus]
MMRWLEYLAFYDDFHFFGIFSDDPCLMGELLVFGSFKTPIAYCRVHVDGSFFVTGRVLPYCDGMQVYELPVNSVYKPSSEHSSTSFAHHPSSKHLPFPSAVSIIFMFVLSIVCCGSLIALAAPTKPIPNMMQLPRLRFWK